MASGMQNYLKIEEVWVEFEFGSFEFANRVNPFIFCCILSRTSSSLENGDAIKWLLTIVFFHLGRILTLNYKNDLSEYWLLSSHLTLYRSHFDLNVEKIIFLVIIAYFSANISFSKKN